MFFFTVSILDCITRCRFKLVIYFYDRVDFQRDIRNHFCTFLITSSKVIPQSQVHCFSTTNRSKLRLFCAIKVFTTSFLKSFDKRVAVHVCHTGFISVLQNKLIILFTKNIFCGVKMLNTFLTIPVNVLYCFVLFILFTQNPRYRTEGKRLQQKL